MKNVKWLTHMCKITVKIAQSDSQTNSSQVIYKQKCIHLIHNTQE